MSSKPPSLTDSSYDAESAHQSDGTRDVSESAVPELDHDNSTEDFTSDYLSTRTTSFMGPAIELDDSLEHAAFDAVSRYSPSRYPSVSMAYRTERPFQDEMTMNSTRSITDLDLDYVMENGRRYCGSYYMPNDEDEQVRLQLINQVYLKVFDKRLTSVPLECPTNILDIGTGIGEWAIDMAEAYPECDVVGTDISNIFERQVPQNVYWEVDDAELDWERPSDYYDLVHLRDMTGAFKDWHFIYKSTFECLKPGGWIEVLDFDDQKSMGNFFSYFDPGSLMHKVSEDLQEASILSGRPRGIGHLEPRFLVNAGYVDVQITEHAIPLRTEDGSTGKFWLLAMLHGLEPLCLRLLTKYKGWGVEDVQLACSLIGEELMSLAMSPRRSRGFIIKVRTLVARKPGHHATWATAPLSASGVVMKRDPEEEMKGGSVQGEGESCYESIGRSHAYDNGGPRSLASTSLDHLTVDEEATLSDAVDEQAEDGKASTTISSIRDCPNGAQAPDSSQPGFVPQHDLRAKPEDGSPAMESIHEECPLPTRGSATTLPQIVVNSGPYTGSAPRRHSTMTIPITQQQKSAAGKGATPLSHPEAKPAASFEQAVVPQHRNRTTSI
ncbi:S-adenosyl-L-methionine-dependent methyltransferase [Xylariomycetidae sp. FL0641]|nr:S-adenosyl-L-methionine-dependent methyltransferase [Xylariomycetidae sp. FL0641]